MDSISSIRFASAFLLSVLSLHVGAEEIGSNRQSVSYNRDVRPILSKSCFACHGPDESTREAGLRLDRPEEVDFDEVVARLESDDPDFRMPPPSANKNLTTHQATVLRHWIESGSEYESHWAFVPPGKPIVHPDRHPVDFFIDERLEEAGLTRSPLADPFTRIRRVYLDLIGLPPPVEEADTFAADPSEAAYAAIVDRLLASPRYGERWARRWLDLARYADTNGYEKDRDRSIWPYRDWVIRSLNDDLPYDRFTIEQIAGDMLPDAGIDQVVATGFHRNTMLNEEGGVDPLEFRFHAMTDRVSTTGATWLGLTTGCCQCHTHKYDPITHHDYYGMMAYLNNADEPNYFVVDQASTAQRSSKLKEAQQLLEELPGLWPGTEAGSDANTNPNDSEEIPDFDAALEKWRQCEIAKIATWRTLVPESMQANYPFLVQESDGVVFASGDTTKHDIYNLDFPASQSPIHSIRLEALSDPRLPGGGPGLTYMEGPVGDFFLSELKIENRNGAPFSIRSSDESFAKNAFGKSVVGADKCFDGDFQSGWSIATRESENHVAVFNLQDPIPAGTEFRVRMHFGRHYPSSIGKFRMSVSDTDQERYASSLAPDVVSALQRTDSTDLQLIREAFLMQAPRLIEYTDRIRKLRRTPAGIATLVMRERPAGQNRPTRLHHRGEYTQPSEIVKPRLPEAIWLSDKPQPQNRLEFAQWLVSRDNPLTARVAVNRQWAAFFGTGIVSTLDDFGMQGELPSHPALLDYLAAEFMDQAWSMKRLHRLIVTSQAYQQSSSINTAEVHPNGRRLLQFFPRTRLEAEVIRDSALFASGLMSEKMYGPPVRPPQPASAVSANYKKSTWTASEGVDRFRRSVYTYQNRTAPFAMFTTFDASSGEACVARRDVSNTPLQALTLMNDPMFLEIADGYGQRMETIDEDRVKKIARGFRYLLTRPPTSEELRMLAEFDQKHANWPALARVMLSLDEAISKN